jgi:PAS domain S-box-containing protein
MSGKHDISQLRETQGIFLELFQQAAISIALLNCDGSLRDVNPCFCRMLGYTQNEVVGKAFREFLHPDDIAKTTAESTALIHDLCSRSSERRYLRKDGTIVFAQTTAAGTAPASARGTVVVTLEEITPGKESHATLVMNPPLFNKLWECQLAGIAVGDYESGDILAANDTFLLMHGYTHDDLESRTINWRNFTAPEHIELVVQADARIRATGACLPFHCDNIRKDGSRMPVLAAMAATDVPRRIVSWTLDVSRQKELEKQLLRNQKMEAVGQLAGGIAHDFNNLLMIIGAHAELAALGNISPETRKYVGRIQTAAKQAAALTRNLLAFSRTHEGDVTDFALGQLAQDVVELVSPSLPRNVQLALRRGTEGWVKADYGKLQQVVVNLVLNALDSTSLTGGRIVVDTSRVAVSDVEVGLHDTVPAGEYALLKVADTGEGISPENIHRIFDPFFSTKPKNLGTGLGLAMVYSAVTQSGGHIRVKSSQSTGTTFCLYLPVMHQRSIVEPRSEPCSREGCSRGTLGKILVVDDEGAVRSSLRVLLEGCGLAVEEASNAIEALQKAATLKDSLAVIVTDVVMPGMSGTEFALALKREHLDVPLVFMSGYAAGEQLQESFEGATFLQKPFSLTALINAVYRAGRCPNANRAKACVEGSGLLVNKALRSSAAEVEQRV